MAKDFVLNTKQDKPRICEVLGVEVDEEFKFLGYDGEYRIHGGRRERSFLSSGWERCECEGILAEMINHPDRIIRKPRFTEDEITFMRYLYGCGVREIKKPKCSDCDISAYDEMVGNCRRTWWLPPCCLPSLRPGESIVLREVVGGAE